MTNHTPTWTPERTETVKRMWMDGKSAGHIAREMGLTRNSVIGKVHRLKLPHHGQVNPAIAAKAEAGRNGQSGKSRGAHHEANKARQAAKTHVKSSALTGVIMPGTPVAPMEIDMGVEPSAMRILTIDLDSPIHPNMCRWIDGDPKADHSYCGKPTGGRSYCATHHERVYHKVTA